MEYQTYAHRAVMQGNTPEPTIWNGADSDSSLGGKGHLARVLPIAPESYILERVVIAAVLQVVH